jgi:hypothetical protein
MCVSVCMCVCVCVRVRGTEYVSPCVHAYVSVCLCLVQVYMAQCICSGPTRCLQNSAQTTSCLVHMCIPLKSLFSPPLSSLERVERRMFGLCRVAYGPSCNNSAASGVPKPAFGRRCQGFGREQIHVANPAGGCESANPRPGGP